MLQTTNIEELPCELTAEEKLQRSAQLAQQLEAKADVEARKKAANDKFKEEVSAIDTKVAELARQIRTGQEYRPIETTERPRYKDMMVDIIRLDTGGIVRTRAMHPSERQQALNLENKNAEKDSPAADAKKTTKAEPPKTTGKLTAKDKAPVPKNKPTSAKEAKPKYGKVVPLKPKSEAKPTTPKAETKADEKQPPIGAN